MLLTREADYALRILRALARGERMTTKQICEAEMIPLPFARKILQKLAAAGCVEMLRGAEGGCVLRADLAALSLYDLLHFVGENLFVNACTAPDFDCPLRNRDGNVCRFHTALAGVEAEIAELLKRRFIGDMV